MLKNAAREFGDLEEYQVQTLGLCCEYSFKGNILLREAFIQGTVCHLIFKGLQLGEFSPLVAPGFLSKTGYYDAKNGLQDLPLWWYKKIINLNLCLIKKKVPTISQNLSSWLWEEIPRPTNTSDWPNPCCVIPLWSLTLALSP